MSPKDLDVINIWHCHLGIRIPHKVSSAVQIDRVRALVRDLGGIERSGRGKPEDPVVRAFGHVVWEDVGFKKVWQFAAAPLRFRPRAAKFESAASRGPGDKVNRTRYTCEIARVLN